MDLDKTVKDLAKTEGEIVDVLNDIVSYLEYTSHKFAHLEGHLGELSKRPPVIVKVPKNSKLFFVVACVASGYIGYKLADRRVQERIKQALAEAQEKSNEFKRQQPRTDYYPN